MRIFHQPSEACVRRLLGEAGLPAADLTAIHLEHFFGCGAREAPQGIVGLEIHGEDALLRSLAVEKSARGQGCGRALVEQAERHAKSCRVRRVYLLTTDAMKFFRSLGYEAVPREQAPERIRATAEFSRLCPSSATLMAKNVTAPAGAQPSRENRP